MAGPGGGPSPIRAGACSGAGSWCAAEALLGSLVADSRSSAVAASVPGMKVCVSVWLVARGDVVQALHSIQA